MIAEKVLRHFRGGQAINTLNAGFDAAKERNWSPNTRAQLYQLAARAFGPAPDYEAFRQLYDLMVSYWKIKRGGGLASAEDIFGMLTTECAAAGRHTGCSLLTGDSQAINAAIRAMEKVKKNRAYPHMAASKFLHFYNPALFPIYDSAVVGQQILAVQFRAEWEDVCDEYGIKFGEPSEGFLITYTTWAGKVMQASDSEIMPAFARRFCGFCDDKTPAPENIAQYHAAAFEYLLMGATKIEASDANGAG